MALTQDQFFQAVASRVARYFDRSSFTEHWRFGNRPKDEDVIPFTVPRFPRTIGDYLNAVATAGLVLTAVEEPQPSLSACEAVPRFARWRDLGAFLLVVMAKRPDDRSHELSRKSVA